nr:site-specific integrase [uncultured Tyzzerella sp.]
MSNLDLLNIDLKYLQFNIKKFTSQGYNYYRIQKQLDKNNKISVIGKTKDIAKQKYFIKLEQYLNEDFNSLDLKNMLFIDFVKYYLFDVVLPSGSIKQKTFSGYEVFYRIHLKNSLLSNIKLKDLKKEHLQKYFNNICKTNLKMSTIKQLKTFISIVLNYAVEEDYILKNYCKSIKLPKDNTIKKDKYLTDEEIKTILKNCKDEQLLLIIKIALSTGMRINEILALTENDFDFENLSINITKTISCSKQFHDEKIYKNENIITIPKSKSSIRKVYFNDKICNDIKKYILSEKERYLKSGKKYNSNIFIFTNKYFKLYNFYSCDVKINNLFKACNIDASGFHIFRHTSGSKLYEMGVNIKTISEQLGHSNTNITSNIYVHLDEKIKKDALKNLDFYFEDVK